MPADAVDDQLVRFLGLQRIPDLADRADQLDAALVEERDPVAQLLGLGHHVRRDEHGPAAVRDALAHEAPEIEGGQRIEAACRLVEEKDLGVADQAAGDGRTLLHPGREVVHRHVGGVLQADEANQLVHSPACPPGRQPVQRRVEAQIFPHG